jgi:hypothetical protein
MKRLILISLAILVFTGVMLMSGHNVSCAQEGTGERILVLRDAQEFRDNAVGVDVYLAGNILEVKVIARMPKSRPNIYNAIVVGPRLGRLSPESRKTLLQTTEEEEPYPVTERGAFMSFRKRDETKKTKGRLARELLLFDIPRDRKERDKKYTLHSNSTWKNYRI